jgi:hypothetical protein
MPRPMVLGVQYACDLLCSEMLESELTLLARRTLASLGTSNERQDIVGRHLKRAY